jgi:hypothetical protein
MYGPVTSKGGAMALESEIDDEFEAFLRDWKDQPNVNEELVRTTARCLKKLAHEIDVLRNDVEDNL